MRALDGDLDTGRDQPKHHNQGEQVFFHSTLPDTADGGEEYNQGHKASDRNCSHCRSAEQILKPRIVGYQPHSRLPNPA